MGGSKKPMCDEFKAVQIHMDGDLKTLNTRVIGKGPSLRISDMNFPWEVKHLLFVDETM